MIQICLDISKFPTFDSYHSIFCCTRLFAFLWLGCIDLQWLLRGAGQKADEFAGDDPTGIPVSKIWLGWLGWLGGSKMDVQPCLG